MFNSIPFDSGCGSLPPLSDNEQEQDAWMLTAPLLAGVEAGSPERVRAALDDLIRQPHLTSSELCATLAAVAPASSDACDASASCDGDTALHAASRPRRQAALEALLDGIGKLARDGRFQPGDLRRLLCAVNSDQESALHVLAHSPGGPGLAGFRALLLRLHDDRHLTSDDLSAVVLQDRQGDTALQAALRHGGPVAIKDTLALFAEALARKAISPRQVIAALNAPSHAKQSLPIHWPFLAPNIPYLEAVLVGVDKLHRVGRMRAADLRDGIGRALDLGDQARGSDTPYMRHERQQVQALVKAARERWFAATAAPRDAAAP